MILKMQSVRVYGSDSQYGDQPCQDPLNEPIRLRNFPSDGQTVEIVLGEPPKAILEAHRTRTAVANILLDLMFGGKDLSENYTFDDAIREQLSNEISVPILKKYSWYVTVALQRQIDVNDELIIGDEFPVVKLPESIRVHEEKAYAKPYIDYLSTIICTVTGTEFFQNVIVDEVLFTSPQGIVTRLFANSDVKMSGRLSVNSPMHMLDVVALKDMLSLENLRSCWKFKSLEGAVHWYSTMLNETDRWKRFQWAFLALEILTHKLSARLYKDVIESLALKGMDGNVLFDLEIPMGQLIGSEKRLSLVAKFSILALSLSPGKAEADVRTFKDAKKVRDRFAHGDVKDASELPTHLVEDLLTRYLAKVLRTAF